MAKKKVQGNVITPRSAEEINQEYSVACMMLGHIFASHPDFWQAVSHIKELSDEMKSRAKIDAAGKNEAK